MYSSCNFEGLFIRYKKSGQYYGRVGTRDIRHQFAAIQIEEQLELEANFRKKVVLFPYPQKQGGYGIQVLKIIDDFDVGYLIECFSKLY